MTLAHLRRTGAESNHGGFWSQLVLSGAVLTCLTWAVGCGGSSSGRRPRSQKPATAPPAEANVAAKKPAAKAAASTAATTAANAASPAIFGSIKGKVILKGTPRKMRRLSLNADDFCQEHHEGEKVYEESVVVGPGGTLKNVIVSISKGAPKSAGAPSEKMYLKQSGCIYTPHVIALQVGQPLEIVNEDGTLHNVHGLPVKNKPFNFGQPNKGEAKEVVLSTQETFKVKCDVHNWMSAYIGVFKHPYFAVTGEDGTFEIKNVPPGSYTVKAWHEFYGNSHARKPTKSLTQKITVGPKEAKVLDFTFEAK